MLSLKVHRIFCCTVPTMGDEGEMVGDSDGDEGSTCSLVKTRHSDRWRHLLAIFSNEQGIIVRGGGVLYICLVCCKISQWGGCANVCLGLTIDVYGERHRKHDFLAMHNKEMFYAKVSSILCQLLNDFENLSNGGMSLGQNCAKGKPNTTTIENLLLSFVYL